jgi:hypothetical protein
MLLKMMLDPLPDRISQQSVISFLKPHRRTANFFSAADSISETSEQAFTFRVA